PIDWNRFMARLGTADFREFATWGQAWRSWGWAGPSPTNPGQWLFGVPRFGRNIPFIGRSIMSHELFHGLQDFRYGLFAVDEANIGIGLWLRTEGAAHLFGGPLVPGIPS